ncbi:MAG: hypothetical protein Q8Q73_18250 [Stagnimonas sp.]|nr:hypothetical protein [Stagnimonas sp.]
MLHTQVRQLEELLQAHAPALGADFTAYRNHCYRVLNLAASLLATDDAETLEKLAIAVAFHDLGIWTDRTFDYLPPSEQRAQVWLAQAGLERWSEEITLMIREHHKLRRYRTEPSVLVEAMRKADWADVSLGLLRFGLPRAYLRELSAAFPNAGFHRRLVQLSLRRLLSHPWSPLPMLRF